MSISYIPPREADFVAWITNFDALILATPVAYGLSAADATALDDMTQTYLTAYTLATAGGTRGPANIAAKDAARANVTARARQLATTIQSNPTISDEQKTALGITVRKTNKTPVPTPTSSPLLAFVAATPLQATLRYADQSTPASRAMPFGAIALQLTVTVAAGSSQQVNVTKNPVAVNFSSGDTGKLATYIGKWVTRTGKVGPSSNVLTQTVIGSGS
jgi:hypothetical protein